VEPILCCQKENLLSILEFVDEALCGRQLSYGLHGHTLLASLRDKRLGDWDLTAELAVRAEDLAAASTLLRDAGRRSGAVGPLFFSKRTGNATSMAPLRITRGKQSSVHVSLVPIQVSGNCSKVGAEWYPGFLFKGAFSDQCELEGRAFPCAGQSAKLLDYKYGNGRGGEHYPWRNGSLMLRVCKDGEACSLKTHGFSCRAALFSTTSVLSSMPSFLKIFQGFLVIYVLVMLLMVLLGVRGLPMAAAAHKARQRKLLLKEQLLAARFEAKSAGASPPPLAPRATSRSPGQPSR